MDYSDKITSSHAAPKTYPKKTRPYRKMITGVVSTKPIRKSNGYLVILKSPQPIRIHRARLQEFVDSASDVTLSLWIPDRSTRSQLMAVEAEIVQIMQENNLKWFNNTMQPEAIAEMFLPAAADNGVFSGLKISRSAEPTTMTVNADVFISLDDWMVKVSALCGGNIKGEYVDLDIQPSAIAIHRKYFKVKWVVKAISYNPDDADGASSETHPVDRSEIEEEWSEKVESACVRADGDIAVYQSKIAAIESFKKDVHAILDSARKMKQDSKEWNSALENLAGKILSYY